MFEAGNATNLENSFFWTEDEQNETPPIEILHFVTAVVISQNGEQWLPTTLKNLRSQSRPVDQFVAADVESTDGSVALLQSAGANFIVHLPAGSTQSMAANACLKEADDRPGHVHWMWILHDDSAPEIDSLENLLKAANLNPNASVIGSKVIDWNDHEHVLEVDSSVTGIGTRFTVLERGELDQGQHDRIHLSHSVSSAGMLVRVDTFAQLGGFTTQIPHYRSELEFCWRVWENGQEVVVAPESRIYHAAASVRELRKQTGEQGSPHFLDRKAGALLVLSRTSTKWLWARYLLLLLSGIFRGLGYLLVQDLAAARDEWRATISAVFSRGRVKVLRQAVGPLPVRRGIRPRFNQQISFAATEILDGIGENSDRIIDAIFPNRVHASEIGWKTAAFAIAKKPSSILAVLAITWGLIASRSAWYGQQLISNSTGVMPTETRILWNEFVANWHAVGMGSTGASHPLQAVLAFLSLFTFNNPATLVVILSALGAWFAALSLHLSLRSFLPHSGTRVWLAGLYGLSPTVTAAISGGDIALIISAILLPPTILLLRRALTSWRAAALASITTAILASIWPAIWFVFIAVISYQLKQTGAGRQIQLRFLSIFAASVLLTAPWSLEVISNPLRWFVEFGASAREIAPAWSVLFGSSQTHQHTGWWWSFALFLVALISLLDRRTNRVSTIAWSFIAVIVVVSFIGQFAATVVNDAIVQPSLSVAAIAVNGALVLCLAASASSIRVQLDRSEFGWKQISTAIAAVLITAMPIVGLFQNSITADLSTGLRRQPEITGSALRGFTDPLRLRTLLVATAVDGSLNVEILDGRLRIVGDKEIADNRDKAVLSQRVASWLNGYDANLENPLRKLGIGYIAVPFEDDAVNRVSSRGNLERLLTARNDKLLHIWRLTDVSSRAYVTDGIDELALLDIQRAPLPPDVKGVITPSDFVRELRLADRTSDQWVATLDGQVLKVIEGETLAWKIPKQASGEILIQFDSGRRLGWLVIAGSTLLAILLVLAPRRRHSYRDEWLDE
jgi:GT2 family glycosyltransferase